MGSTGSGSKSLSLRADSGSDEIESVPVSVVDPDPYWIRVQGLPGSGSVSETQLIKHFYVTECAYS